MRLHVVDYKEIFAGVPPSKSAAQLVRSAYELGLDPTGITMRAGQIATSEGRNKVGGFGGAARVLDQLREVVVSQRWQLDKRNPNGYK